MIGWLLQHLQLIRKALRGRSESPRRLAVAVALGVLLGLIPKGNLIAAAVTVVILGSTANAGAALLTATVVSFAAVLVDPLSHRIGLSILTHESLYPFWQSIYQVPVVPWTHFDHTVVSGGLIVGLVLFYPAYRISYAFFNRNNAKTVDDVQPLDEPDEGKVDAGQPPSVVVPVAEVVRLQNPESHDFGDQCRCDASAANAIPELHEPAPVCQDLMVSDSSSSFPDSSSPFSTTCDKS